MHAAKHSWPKSNNMYSKELNAFNRPRLTNTTLIIHGHLVHVALSPHVVSANSSRSCEILMHGLSLLSRRLDLRHCVIHCQADNCSKELKNNTMLQQMATLCALKKVRAVQLSYLSSGHSHEDIDSTFSQFAAHLETSQDLWTPTDYVNYMQRFFANTERRPWEKASRKVYLLTQFRDWTLKREFSNSLFYDDVQYRLAEHKSDWSAHSPKKEEFPAELASRCARHRNWRSRRPTCLQA